MTEPQRLTTLRAHVEYLASPDRQGRAPGTPGGLAARRYLEAAFAELSLTPAGTDGYQQPIPEIAGANLLGTIPGRGPHSDRYVVVAAHYDHLGLLWGRVYPGADDNAAGVAVLLEAAARLGGRDLDRSILIASFDAEEPPYFLTEQMGSVRWVAEPTLPLTQVDVMICLDLVGHALGPPSLPEEIRRSVFLLGAERSPGVGSLVDRVGGTVEGIYPRRVDGDLIPPLSDYYAFERAGIPSLFFTLGRDRHYHTPEDTPDKLDYPKMAALADLLVDLTVALAAHPEYRYDADAHDDPAAVSTLIELGRHAGTRHHEQVTALIDTLEGKLGAGVPLSRRDRAALQAALLALEEALG